MSISHRLILLLVAFPFSAALASGVYLFLSGRLEYDLLIAAIVFVLSELLLGYAASKIPASVGREAIPGREVEVLSDFAKQQCGSYIGYVQLDGERWRACIRRGEGTVPRTGSRVRVESIDGLTLLVSRASNPPHAAPVSEPNE